MKKLILIILSLCICLGLYSDAFAASKIPDISKLSEEQLLQLRNQIDTKLEEMKGNRKYLYDDKDVTITWIGVEIDLFDHLKNGMLITNKTNKPIYYGITKIAYNGIQISAMNSMLTMEIESGMSYLTTTNNISIVDIGSLSIVGIKSVEDITDVYLEISFYKTNDFGAKAFKTCKLRFSI